jgi:16S rRNA (guanine527-N7)-methyltransferase
VLAEALKSRLNGLVTLKASQIAALESHYELLLRWNRSLNLTTVTNVEEAAERHYCEAIFVAAHLPSDPHRIVDIGSEAGFPGIPVAILRPDCPVFLIEAHQRKAVFLREASRGMTNVKVLPRRAEDVVEEFDRAISRAVSYADLRGSLAKLARSADLLTGADEPPQSLGFCWNPGIRLPWGENRFLRSGVRTPQ